MRIRTIFSTVRAALGPLFAFVVGLLMLGVMVTISALMLGAAHCFLHRTFPPY